MSDLELKRKESLTKAEVAKRLSAFAKALAGGDDVELEMGGTSMSLRVPDDVRVEFEVEVDGDEIEIEIELKWSTSSAADRAEPAPDGERRRGKEHGGAREQQAEPARLRRTEDRASTATTYRGTVDPMSLSCPAGGAENRRSRAASRFSRACSTRISSSSEAGRP